jgi:signal transduction histidine kinase
MRERAELAGGWFRIESRSGQGTTVWCWLPDDGPPILEVSPPDDA